MRYSTIAGASEDGKGLAARIGEMLYTAAQDIEEARAFYADVKDRAAALGRARDHILVLPGVMPVIGRTRDTPYGQDLAVSPDGKTVLVERGEWTRDLMLIDNFR